MSNSKTVVVAGPLAAYAVEIDEQLTALGYAQSTRLQVQVTAAALSRWLQDIGLSPAKLTDVVVEQFRDDCVAHAIACPRPAVRRLVMMLRSAGVLGDGRPVQPATKRELMVAGYVDFLREERGLSSLSIEAYRSDVHRFLQRCKRDDVRGLGSDYYVKHFPATELAKIKFDLDADVTATPNYVAGVLEPKDGVTLFGRNPGTPMPPSIWAPSAIGRDYGIDYLNSIGKNHILFSADGTDALKFQEAGVPASGVLTGQDCCKLASDVALSAATRATSRATCRETTGAAWTTPSAGATTSATTTPRC